MKINCSALGIIALFGCLPTAVAAAQTLQPIVTYVCNWKGKVVASGNISDLSDAATCTVLRPDRSILNGSAGSSEARGSITKQIACCTPLLVEEIGRTDVLEKERQDLRTTATEKKPNGRVGAFEYRVQWITTDRPAQTTEQRNLVSDVPDNFKSDASPNQVGLRGYAILWIVAFPNQAGAADSMVGHTFVLLKDSFDNLLLKSGLRPPTGKTILRSWGLACRKGASECRQVVDVMSPYVVAGVRMDATGKVRFSPAVVPGTYYLFGSSRYGNHAVAWDFPVTLKPGTNWITLDQNNAVPFD